MGFDRGGGDLESPRALAIGNAKQPATQRRSCYRLAGLLFLGIVAAILVLVVIPSGAAEEQGNLFFADACKQDETEDIGLPPPVAAALSVSDDGTSHIISSNAGMVVHVRKANCDIISLVLDGVELQSNKDNKFSHIQSGLGAEAIIDTDGESYALVTCNGFLATHYMMFRGGENTIYMATNQEELNFSELRMLFRLKSSVLDVCKDENIAIPEAVVIEGQDILARPDGITTSKFYGAHRLIDLTTFGASSSQFSVGAYFAIPPLGTETGVGGPFFRDIERNCQVGSNADLTFYMHSDHTRTEDYRLGMHGPYAFTLTSGPAPNVSSLDFTFVDRFKIPGLVPATLTDDTRGRVVGTLSVPSGLEGRFNYTIGLNNANSQYWTKAPFSPKNSTVLEFIGPLMKPGAYKLTLYQGELEVFFDAVNVTSGECQVYDAIAATAGVSDALWRIGELDGTPKGFAGADLIERMHPTDVRMPPVLTKNDTVFRVGVTPTAEFPMVISKEFTPSFRIEFELTASQAEQNYIIKLYASMSFLGGRVNLRVNGSTPRNSPIPTQPRTRGLTRGTWRGNNFINSRVVNAALLQPGINILELQTISGSSSSGFLAPNVVVDSIEMVPT